MFAVFLFMEISSDDGKVVRWEPALTAVGEGDVVPAANGIQDADLSAFVKDEQVLGCFS